MLEDVNFEDALEDGAYDTNDTFEFMKSNGVDCPGIKIRRNAVVGKEELIQVNSCSGIPKMGYKG